VLLALLQPIPFAVSLWRELRLPFLLAPSLVPLLLASLSTSLVWQRLFRPPVPLQLAPTFAASKPEPTPFLRRLRLLFLSLHLLQPTLLSTSPPSQQYATPPVPLRLAPTFAASKLTPAPFLQRLTPLFLSLQPPLPISQ